MRQQYNNTTESRKNKHLTEKERYKIEILMKEGLKPIEIAKRLERHVRTIERKIAKGKVRLINSDLTYRNEYCADTGQRKYDESRTYKGPQLKIGNDHKLASYIERKIKEEKYSPDAVIGEIKEKKLEFKTSISTKTLYNYIDQNLFTNISNKDLPVKRNGKQGGSGAVLLVLSERKTRREEIIIKMPNKKQESVISSIDNLEMKYGNEFKNKFKTITVDNGSEFLEYKGLKRSC